MLASEKIGSGANSVPKGIGVADLKSFNTSDAEAAFSSGRRRDHSAELSPNHISSSSMAGQARQRNSVPYNRINA